MTLDLSVFITKPQFVQYSCTLSIFLSSLSSVVESSTKSSAYNKWLTLESCRIGASPVNNVFPIALINMLNKRGLKTLPWLTPCFISIESVKVFLHFTRETECWYNDLLNSYILPFTPALCNFNNKPSCQMVSKAFLKSIKHAYYVFPLPFYEYIYQLLFLE